MSSEIHPIPVLQDNYAWGLQVAPGRAAVVDPGEAAPVEAWLDRQGLDLAAVLLTHHHGDHVGGAEALVRRRGGVMVGNADDRGRLPPLALPLEIEHGEAAAFSIEGCPFTAIPAPGHTRGHLVYVVGDALFAGDVLFSFGCGRIFEGTMEEAWSTLARLARLPDHLRLACGHEYTEANLRFALHLEPGRGDLVRALQDARRARSRGLPTLPAPLEREKRLNPFLRCDDPALTEAAGAPWTGTRLFEDIRRRKDMFA